MKRTNLYLDDEAACLKILLDLLVAHYEVRTAQTPTKARALLAERPAASGLGDRDSCVTAVDATEATVRLASAQVALVISDVNVSSLSGVELLRRIVEHFPDMAVVMVSGVARRQRVLDSMRMGAPQRISSLWKSMQRIFLKWLMRPVPVRP